MNKPWENLGALSKVELRDVWENESAHFTPWLAQANNLLLLADTIGLDLEMQGTEHSVGPFKADILCKDTASDTYVLIENQIERTDHCHLGQLLTYAAGLRAVTIVWISARFTDEHRAALDWLNEITDERINFFGLEIELWKIGTSQVAPKFNVISKPNDWSKTVATTATRNDSTELSEGKLLQLKFWGGFNDYVSTRSTSIKTTKPLPQHWMNIALGRSGTKLSAIASLWDSESESFDNQEIRAEVVLFNEYSKTYFEQLFKEKDLIEKELGESLIWRNPDNTQMCRIYIRKPANLETEDNWPAHHKWILEKLEALSRVFAQRIRRLQTNEAGNGE